MAEDTEAAAADERPLQPFASVRNQNFMKTQSKHTIHRILSIGLLAMLSISTLGACHSGPLNTLTQENLDKIQPDMSSAQVKAILGEPTDSKTEPIPIVGGTKTTYTYDNDKDHVVIVLKNDMVQTKEGNFGQ